MSQIFKKSEMEAEALFELTQNIRPVLMEYVAFWQCLNDDEQQLFIDFVSSKLNKANRITPELARHLNISIKNNEIVVLEYENLIRRYSAGRKSDSLEIHIAKLQERCEELLELGEKFLVYQQAMNHKLSYQRLLVKSLKERNNQSLFLQSVNQFKTSLNKAPYTLMIAADKWWLDHQTYYYQHAEQVPDSKAFEQNLLSFEAFNQIVLLRNYLELLNRGAITPEADKWYLVYQNWAHSITPKSTLSELYLLMIEILLDKDSSISSYYPTFKENFQQAEYKLAKVDQLVLTKTCINYLATVYYHWGAPWLDEMFDWMSYASQKGLYNFEGTISDDEYLNFFSVGMALERKAELVFFEKTYTKFLDKTVKSYVTSLCNLYKLQKDKQIEMALTQLEIAFPKKSQIPLTYDLRVKGLRIMLGFEYMLLQQKDGQTLDELTKSIDNFSKFCRRQVQDKKLQAVAAEPHLNFCKLALKLYKMHNQFSHNAKLAIRTEIISHLEQKIPLANQSWITSQL